LIKHTAAPRQRMPPAEVLTRPPYQRSGQVISLIVYLHKQAKKRSLTWRQKMQGLSYVYSLLAEIKKFRDSRIPVEDSAGFFGSSVAYKCKTGSLRKGYIQHSGVISRHWKPFVKPACCQQYNVTKECCLRYQEVGLHPRYEKKVQEVNETFENF